MNKFKGKEVPYLHDTHDKGRMLLWHDDCCLGETARVEAEKSDRNHWMLDNLLSSGSQDHKSVSSFVILCQGLKKEYVGSGDVG